MVADPDELFLKHVLAHDLVTPEEIKRCQKEQRREAKQGRRYYLGQIMIQRRLLSCEQFLEIENALEQKIYECATCKSRYARSELRKGFACAGCGREVAVPGGGKLSMAEILASRDPRDLTISLAPAAEAARTRTSARRRSSRRRGGGEGGEGEEEGRGKKRLNRTALEVETGDLDGLDRYEVIEELGRGGMGVVFKAHQAAIDRICALKVIKAGPNVPEVQINRFVQEGKSAARLNHPNIISIYDCGRSKDMFFVAMEYIEGQSLQQLLGERKRLEVPEALGIFADILAAVGYAHENGVVHRDLKPANILIEKERGRAKLIDFGLAKDTDYDLGLTQEGQILGSPFYLSPEQTRGKSKDVDGRSDVFALGVILYEVLTGQRPFSGRSAAEVYSKILHGRPTPPTVLEPAIEQELQAIVLKALEKEPGERFQSTADFALRLERYSEARSEQLGAQTTRRLDVVGPERLISGRSRRGGSGGTRNLSGRSTGRAARATGKHLRPGSTTGRVSGNLSTKQRSVRAEPAAPPRSSAAPLVVGALLVCALGAGFLALQGGSQPEVAASATPVVSPSEAPDASGVPSPSETLPPEEHKSPARRAFERADDYLRANPQDLLGAFPLFRDAAGRDGIWAEKAQGEANRLGGLIEAEATKLADQAFARAQVGRIGEALDLLAQASERYEGMPGGERLERRRLMVEMEAVEQARQVVERAEERTKAGDAQGAIKLLEDYEETGVEGADSLITKAIDALAPDLRGPSVGTGGEAAARDGSMVQVEAGEFQMGLDLEGAPPDEAPARRVTLSAFQIDRYEVTNHQYAQFLTWIKQNAGQAHRFCHADEPRQKDHVPLGWGDPRYAGAPYPVVGVDWFDAYAFARWAGKRLPTEAEWERAARGARGRLFPWGDRFEPSRVHYAESLFGRQVRSEEDVQAFVRWLQTYREHVTLRVDIKDGGASPEEAHHLSGNVAEWVGDYYAPDRYAKAGAERDPQGPSRGRQRVLRGGSWVVPSPVGLTGAARGPQDPLLRRLWNGFRCALSAGEQPSDRLR